MSMVRISQAERIRLLEESQDAVPVVGTVDVDVPIDQLWDCFRHAYLWPKWNHCFCWVRNDDLVRDHLLIWAFEPIKAWYLYRMPAVARIVEVEPQKKVTWEVTAFPGMYARHTYYMDDLGSGRTRFGSWEKGMGSGFRMMQCFWTAHFQFVNRESLAGVQRLENIFSKYKSLNDLRGLHER